MLQCIMINKYAFYIAAHVQRTHKPCVCLVTFKACCSVANWFIEGSNHIMLQSMRFKHAAQMKCHGVYAYLSTQ